MRGGDSQPLERERLVGGGNRTLQRKGKGEFGGGWGGRSHYYEMGR